MEEVSATTFNIQEVSKRHPTSIARSILYIAVCVQQLDPNFDTSHLNLLPTVDARLDKYMSTVQSLVTSDDEMVATTEGLECLILQGLYHINAGNPRRAVRATGFIKFFAPIFRNIPSSSHALLTQFNWGCFTPFAPSYS